MKIAAKFVTFLLLFALSISIASAHEEISTSQPNLPEPLTVIYYAVWISGLAILASLVFKPNRMEKKIIFVMIAVPVAISTFYLAADTVYLNLVSESHGPVHWHADYEVWVCVKKLELIKPSDLENKVGSPLLHSHEDDRIHVEGVLAKLEDARLESYFDVIGGKLTESEIVYPTENGAVSAKNGDLCNGKPAKLQVFVYKTKGSRYHQEKIRDFPHYTLSPQGHVPPGDCIIIEFGEEKDSTDRICETYKLAINKGDIIGG